MGERRSDVPADIILDIALKQSCMGEVIPKSYLTLEARVRLVYPQTTQTILSLIGDLFFFEAGCQYRLWQVRTAAKVYAPPTMRWAEFRQMANECGLVDRSIVAVRSPSSLLTLYLCVCVFLRPKKI
jgi:hypothetical protein